MEPAAYAVPEVDGALLADPPVEEWPSLVASNARTADAWELTVLGSPISVVRARARRDALDIALRYSREWGLPAEAEAEAPIVVTGHQPTMFHPGVWAKHLLLDDLAARVGGVGIDLVVDSDAADSGCAAVPASAPDGSLVAQEVCLFDQAPGLPFESVPAPGSEELDRWLDGVVERLSTLDLQGPVRAVEQWRAAARRAAGDRTGPRSIGDLFTAARRRFEATLGTTYLELPMSRLAGSDAFLTFALDACFRGSAFCTVYNDALDSYREARGIRSPANPFPDLEEDDGRQEMPFWVLTDDGRREPLWVERRGDSLAVLCGSCEEATIPAGGAGPAVAALREAGLALRPKALALTMFLRLFIADLFVHGVGGAKYDTVTDAIIARCYGIEPPRFAVASLTMYLPLDVEAADADTPSALRQRLSALEHNPDRFLDELGAEAAPARELARRKRGLVDEIARAQADKKALGTAIRAVNESLREYVRPLIEATELRIERAEAAERSEGVARRRDYAYFMFEPEAVAEAIRRAAVEPV